MINGEFWELDHATDRELQSELTRLPASGSRTEARIIAHLAAVEDRRLYLEAGSSSLFDYCWRRLGLSENEAFHRITAARLARRFPAIIGLIERRAMHLSAVCLLRDYLTPENHQELLQEASGKTKFQVQELVARRFPRADVASTIRKLPVPRTQLPEPSGASVSATLPQTAPSNRQAPRGVCEELLSGAGPALAPIAQPAHSGRSAVIDPLSASRYRIQLNASTQLKEKLDHAVELLSHSNPSGDLTIVVERALDLLIERVQEQRFAQTKRPRRSRASEPNEGEKSVQVESVLRRKRRGHIPNATKRQIAARDGLRCTFVGSDGQRCAARRFTQIHHEHPWARGGDETADNLRILCAAHNRLLAERDFGRELVADRIHSRREGVTRSPREQTRGNSGFEDLAPAPAVAGAHAPRQSKERPIPR